MNLKPTYQLETIPFHKTDLPVVDVDGEPRVVVRHAYEQIGMSGRKQVEKLQKQPWADVSSVTVSVTRAGHDVNSRVLTCDVRTFLMALAQVSVMHVPEHVRPILAQRYGIDLDVHILLRNLRDAGVLKQTNSPRKPYRDWFWFTGSTWNVHPHILPKLARKIADTRKVLGDIKAIQLELALNNEITAGA